MDKGDVVHIHHGIGVYVAIPFSRGSSQPRDWTWVFRLAGRFFTIWATRYPSGTVLSCERDEMTPPAAARMDLEAVILSKSDRERQIPCDITYIRNLKKKHKWTDLQNGVTDVENKIYGYLGEMGVGRDKLGDWAWYTHSTIYKTDK